MPDARWGAVVCAAIVQGASLDEAALASHIDARLASHKRPRMVYFVNDLPTVTLGKLDRASAPSQLGPLVRPLAR